MNYEDLITKEYMQNKFSNIQNYIIIAANILNIRAIMVELVDINTDQSTFIKLMGVSNLILLLSLNKYLY